MPVSICNQAGKGWTPGHYRSKAYRQNFDQIFRKKQTRKTITFVSRSMRTLPDPFVVRNFPPD